MSRLNVLLAQTDQLGAIMKKHLLDAIAQFKNKQAHFKGEKVTYTPKAAEFADSKQAIDKPVASTVEEWLKYGFAINSDYLRAKLDQEATNCSGTARAELRVEGVFFGIYTTGELMALKGFFEQQAFRDLFEAIPTISLTERWAISDNPEYAGRGILESPIQEWVDKSTETTPTVVFDPAGKQPGVTINVKSTIEKAEVTRQLFTGEMSHADRAAMLARLSKLIIAIKSALEVANQAEVVESQGNPTQFFTYLLGKPGN